MRTRLGIWLVCGLAMLCACSAPAPEESDREQADSSLTLSEVAAPTQRETVRAAAHYVFLEGTLVGAWENGAWHSAENGEDQALDQPLQETVYYTYSPEQYLGTAEKVTLETAGSEAKEESLPLPVPAEEPDDWRSYTAHFGAENCTLAVSDSADCLPSVVQWKGGDAVSQEDLVAVQLTAAQEGLEQALTVQTAVVDFDGDGKQETYIFANTMPPETGEPAEQAALVLLREEDSRVETVYARLVSPEEQISELSLTPVGIYDLNGDGAEEVCLRVREGNLVSLLVVSRTDERWEIVLHSAMNE